MTRILPEIKNRPSIGVKATNEGHPNYDAIRNEEPENGFLLKCGVCDQKAAVVDIYKKYKEMRISSALRSFVIKSKQLEDIIISFKKKDLGFIHQYLINCNGLDGYCPDCKKVYCHDHWQLNSIFDGSFSDYTKGECPKGHKRILDD
ncbi:MAG: hypothetical protein Q7J54_05200 [Candidatus Woesearchaeota archaeon]|nr:hypothetical protein [Candidatus Woesearchaeota archaeon]